LPGDWFSGIGPSVTTRPVIRSVAVSGVLTKGCGPKLRPPSMLVVRVVATRARAASYRASR
jgi:hypothetical protein